MQMRHPDLLFRGMGKLSCHPMAAATQHKAVLRSLYVLTGADPDIKPLSSGEHEMITA